MEVRRESSSLGRLESVQLGTDVQPAASPSSASLLIDRSFASDPITTAADRTSRILTWIPGRASAILSADLAALSVAFFAGLAIGDAYDAQPTLSAKFILPWFGLFIVTALLTFAAYGLYDRVRRRIAAWIFEDLAGMAHALLVATALLAICAYLLTRQTGLPAPALPTFAIMGALALVSVSVLRGVMSLAILPRTLSPERVAIIGKGLVSEGIWIRLRQRSECGLTLVGFIDDEPHAAGRLEDGDAPLLGGLSELSAICQEHRIERLLVAFSRASSREVVEALRGLSPQVRISVVPRFFDLVTWRSVPDELDGLPLVDVAPSATSSSTRFAKRTFDIVLATVLIILLGPVLAAIAIAIRLTSPGPVIFGQLRAGRGSHPFKMFKFRTMRDGAEAERQPLLHLNDADGPLFKLRSDPRVTRFGRFFRATSLDELPQLFNVLRGEMSLVGPRPFVIDESQSFSNWAARRFDVRPGMTGLWQVSGRTDRSFDELQALDYQYVSSWSLLWDLKILCQTPAVVFGGRNGY